MYIIMNFIFNGSITSCEFIYIVITRKFILYVFEILNFCKEWCHYMVKLLSFKHKLPTINRFYCIPWSCERAVLATYRRTNHSLTMTSFIRF